MIYIEIRFKDLPPLYNLALGESTYLLVFSGMSWECKVEYFPQMRFSDFFENSSHLIFFVFQNSSSLDSYKIVCYVFVFFCFFSNRASVDTKMSIFKLLTNYI